ncbi:MAG: toprim domain-containing protein [Erythrobacter sp.]|uniref:DUF7146 domain-containing protein n=1 Tax=Erythrobacter sp. TaxID=1042 RepID=UPI003263277E
MTDARELTLSLKGRWYGEYGAAPCPVCQPASRRTQNALTLADGKNALLLHCKRSGCDFRDILAAASLGSGDYCAPDPALTAKRKVKAKADALRKHEAAKRLWQECQPITGTIAETYLRSRMIDCALPDTLRFHSRCWHGPSKSRWPAMVALVEGGQGFAVHRTYLCPDGSGKARLAGGDKLMLGATSGGAVRLSEEPSRLAVAEGIESGLSLLCGLLGSPASVWASLSTSGMRSLRLPVSTDHLIIAGDGDVPGREAGYSLARRASERGWQVSTLNPGDGADFNDILARQAVAA